MSVMPGMGRGTKEESTIETRKTPMRPKDEDEVHYVLGEGTGDGDGGEGEKCGEAGVHVG